MIKFAEEDGEGKKSCTYSCRSSFYAEALLRALQTNGVTTYDHNFSDGTLSFNVDACNYEHVSSVLNKPLGDGNA